MPDAVMFCLKGCSRKFYLRAYSIHMKQLLIIFLCCNLSAAAQKLTENKDVIKNIKKHITFLADDKLEGRRTGSKGEQIAAGYISKAFKKAGLTDISVYNGYLQAFEVNDGRQIMPETNFTMNGHRFTLLKDYFPLSYSGNGSVNILRENKLLADTFDIASLLEQNKTNPHFDLNATILLRAAEAKRNGKTALLVNNSGPLVTPLKFDEKDKTPKADIPIIFSVNREVPDSVKKTPGTPLMTATISIDEKKRTGHNVIGFINNNAANTIVLGAHYDHLGYGEDRNSLYTGETKMIHNGADDNASGTAALIELSRLLKQSKLKNNNYLLVAFSGEELGLYGSKYFVDHLPPGTTINYMINMDMLGRLNDSTRGLTVGGFGTSPLWNDMVKSTDPYFKIKLDSSGSGPSDHTSFYRKDIPVLFFFTGTHRDYHKPSDDADKINYGGEAAIIQYIYNLVSQADNKGKLTFTKTREAAAMGTSSFRVTLGIMPDYTYNGAGVLVDGVSDGRPAQKAGIKQGDVVTQLGEHKFSDVQSYMSALNKFSKGQSTKVKLMRGKEEVVLDVTF